MWKKWETVAETERNKITELADTYDVPVSYTHLTLPTKAFV